MVPLSTDLLQESAYAASLARDLDSARDLYRKSLEIDAKDPRSYMGLADLDSAQGNLAEALRSYTAAAAVDRKHFEARARRAELLERLGRHPEAIAANREALAVRPDDLKTLVGLARMYERVGDYGRAVASAERAYGLMPENLRQSYRDTLARLRRLLQERQESAVSSDRTG
jgi:tetratricopeptide (TPR) repeat protein